MKDLRIAFLAKYPKYEIILNMYSRANDCPATWENLSKVRLQTFVDYMEERLAPNSVRQYAAKLKAVLNLYNEEVELPKDYNKILSVKNVRSTNVFLSQYPYPQPIAFFCLKRLFQYATNIPIRSASKMPHCALC